MKTAHLQKHIRNFFRIQESFDSKKKTPWKQRKLHLIVILYKTEALWSETEKST